MSRLTYLNQIIQSPFITHQIKEACGVSFRAFGMSDSRYYSVHRDGVIHVWAMHVSLLETVESLNHVKTN